jgi:tetratricopeptide (TPR) repeat protein
MRYKDSALSDDQIARSLHAKYVLEGSVRRDGDLVRVSAQVVRIEDQTRVWTEQYDHQLTSAAEMQDELATVITKGVHTTLTGHETTTAQLHQSSYGSATHEAAPAQSSGSDASDLTQHAKLAVGQRSAQGLTQGIALYNQALARDPTDAAAWAGLAEAYTRTSTLGLAAPEQVMSQARAAAARALELDPNLAAAHLAAGSIAESFDYDWQQAAEEFRKAISLDPAAAAAHAAYALLLARQGQFAPAMAESARALAAEPLSPALATDHATVLYLAGDYQAAAQTVSRTLALAPGAAGLRLLIASEAAQGQLQAALAQARAYHEAVPTSEASASLAYLYGRAGQSSEAEQALRAMEDEAASEGSDPLPLRAMALAGMGDKERLLATLDEAYREHADFLSTLKVDPAYAALSGDARFEELMHRVGLD